MYVIVIRARDLEIPEESGVANWLSSLCAEIDEFFLGRESIEDIMTSEDVSHGAVSDEGAMENKPETSEDRPRQATPSRWKRWLGGKSGDESSPEVKEPYRSKSTLGILSDKQTDEVPGKYNRIEVTQKTR